MAFEVIQRALSNGKHVVTANKALIARGNELFALRAPMKSRSRLKAPWLVEFDN